MTFDLKRIAVLEPLEGYRMAIAWDDAPGMEVDLSDFIRYSTAFEPIRDPNLFKLARIGEHRRVVEWPLPADAHGDPVLDIDAETLFAIAVEQRGGCSPR